MPRYGGAVGKASKRKGQRRQGIGQSRADFERRRGLQAVATAMRPELDAWRLVVAGDGEAAYVASLKSLAERAGVAARVSFEGWVEGDRKRNLGADLVVHALVRRPQLFAGLVVRVGDVTGRVDADGEPLISKPSHRL